jgi:predicted transcriptional regulator
MTGRPPVSRAELETARVLWQLGEATPRQVYEAHPKKKKLAFDTIQTYLERLETKGYIRARREGKKKFYRERVRPQTVIRQTVDDFLEGVFHGEALPLVRYLIRDKGMTNEEIRQLREILNQLEADSDESAEP